MAMFNVIWWKEWNKCKKSVIQHALFGLSRHWRSDRTKNIIWGTWAEKGEKRTHTQNKILALRLISYLSISQEKDK